MAVDPALASMLSAITAKIQGLSAGNATAEDTALMGFAIEKIAGQISAMEIQLLGDEQKSAILTEATAKLGAIDTNGTAALAAIAAALANAVDEITEALSAYNANDTQKTGGYNTNATSKTNTFNSNATTRTNSFNSNAATRQTEATDAIVSTRDASLASVRGIAPNLFLTETFDGSSVMLDARGNAVSYTSASGVTYSEAVYDGQNRLTSWRESVTVSGATISFRYTASYHPINGDITAITRVAA